MSQVNIHQGTSTQMTTGIDDVEILTRLSQSGNEIQNIPPDKGGNVNTNMELPVLPKPSLAAGSSLSLDILLDAIGDKVRQSETNAGLATVKANAAQREVANKEKLQKIDEQIEKLEKASIWDKISSVFKWIGMAAAAIACVAMVATGVGAGIGAVGLTLLAVSLADTVLDAVGQAATGRGWGLTSLVGWAVEAASGSESAGMWVKMGLDIALSIATIIATCGGGGAATATDATKIEKIASLLGKIATVTQSGAGVAGAGASAANAVYTYQASSAQADQKKLQAILEQIQMINDVVTQHMKQVIEDSQKTTETVNDIVKENAAMQTEILTGGGGVAMS